MLTLPAMSVELFRYRGTANDGGTIDYIFETDEPSPPKTVSEENAAEIAARLDDDFLPSADRGAGEPGISYQPNSVLAFLLLRNDSGTDPENVLRRSVSQRDGCSADSGRAAVVRGTVENQSRSLRARALRK
jgi:hypothetical protein